jgi:hypothetical protein
VRTQGTTEVKDEADRGSRAEHLHGDADQQSECAGGQQDAERNHPSPTSSPSRADIRNIRSVDSDAVVETLRARTGLRGPPRWRPRPAWFSYHHLQYFGLPRSAVSRLVISGPPKEFKRASFREN